jgi:hypothetical protein
MTLGKLIDIIDEAYGEDRVKLYFEDPDGAHGDSLARFIAIEIRETYDPSAATEKQIEEAMRCMSSARGQLEDVIKALVEHH